MSDYKNAGEQESIENRITDGLRKRAGGGDESGARERVWARVNQAEQAAMAATAADARVAAPTVTTTLRSSWIHRVAPAASVALFLLVTVSSIIALPRPGSEPYPGSTGTADSARKRLPAIGSEQALAERIVAGEMRVLNRLLNGQRGSHPLNTDAADSLVYAPGGSSRLHALGTAFTLGDGMNNSNNTIPHSGYSSLEAPVPGRSGPMSAQEGRGAMGAPFEAYESPNDAGRSAPKSFGGAPGSRAHSLTDLQEAGVDEADSYKTDGRHIYRVNGSVVQVIKAAPIARMKTEYVIDIGRMKLTPTELYLHQGKLVVIASGNGESETSPLPPAPRWGEDDSSKEETRDDIAPGFDGDFIPGGRIAQEFIEAERLEVAQTEVYTAILIYDVSDHAGPRLERRLSVSGSYVSSRRVDGTMHMVSSTWLELPPPRIPMTPKQRADQVRAWLPRLGYLDSAHRPERRAIGMGTVRPIGESTGPQERGGHDFVTATSVDLDSKRRPPSVQTFLASSGLVYSSRDHLYLAAQEYSDRGSSSAPEPSVTIYRFDMTPSGLSYSRRANVPGEIHDRFSLDESDGYLRVFTTAMPDTVTPEPPAAGLDRVIENRLTILDSGMKKVGSVTGIAPGERIQSARCGEDRCYLVTFREVDPFFAIDVSDPRRPKVLGELKVPGFSTNLWLVGGNDVLGIGVGSVTRDGVEQPMGVRASLYDAGDARHPKLRSAIQIGNDWNTRLDTSGPDSSKAMMIAPEAGIIGIPVRSSASQRVEILRISKARGLELFGSVGNMPLGESKRNSRISGHTDVIPPPYRWRGYENRWEGQLAISRMLYIGSDLYTLSPWQVRSYDLTDLSLRAILDSPSTAYIRKDGQELERADHRRAKLYLTPAGGGCIDRDSRGRPYRAVADIQTARTLLGYKLQPTKPTRAGTITDICITDGDAGSSGDAQVVYSTGVRLHVKRTGQKLDVIAMISRGTSMWLRGALNTEAPPARLHINGHPAYGLAPSRTADQRSGEYSPGAVYWQVGKLRYSLIGQSGMRGTSLQDLLHLAREQSMQ